MRAVERAALIVLAASLSGGLAACGGGEESGEAIETRSSAPVATTASATSASRAPRARPRRLPGLPAAITGFQRWTRLNTAPIPPNSRQTRRVGFDAHLGTKQVYVNRTRARLRDANGRQRFPYPNGTVLVKTARDDGFIRLVAIMRKVRGADAAHGDWRFVEYHRDSADEPFTTGSGLRDATCWSCHAIAEDTDWAFTTLE